MTQANRLSKVLLPIGLFLVAGGCTPKKLTISSVEPATGVVAGGENVVLRGGGFTPGKTTCHVKIGKNEATNIVLMAEDKIQVTTPAGTPGPADVMVTFEDGRTFNLAGGFVYRAPDQAQTRDAFLGSAKTEPEPATK